MIKIARIAVLVAALAALIFFGAKYIRSNHGQPQGGETATRAIAGNEAETSPGSGLKKKLTMRLIIDGILSGAAVAD